METMRKRFDETFINVPTNTTMSGFKLDCDVNFVIDFIEQELKKEREEIIEIIDKYGKDISKLHDDCIATAHEDSKMMLAFDMHSRLIAVKHIINTIKNRT